MYFKVGWQTSISDMIYDTKDDMIYKFITYGGSQSSM